MGWKISGALAFGGPEGYLGTCPEHNSDAAREIVSKLGFHVQQSNGMVELLSALDPDWGQISIGAFELAILISHSIDIEINVEDSLSTMYPDWDVFCFATVSNESYFEYSLFRHGQLIRRHRGDQEKILEETGDLLPAERTWFDKSVIRDGKRFVHRDSNRLGTREVPLHLLGEELVGIAMTPYFGCQFFPPKPFKWTAECHPSMVKSGQLTNEEFLKLSEKLSQPNPLPELEVFDVTSQE